MADAAKKDEKAQPAKEDAKKKGGGSKLVPLLLLVNSLLLAGVLVMLVLKPGGAHGAANGGDKGGEERAAPDEHGGHAEKSGHAEKAKDGKEGAPGPSLRLPDFVVHLRDADADRYVRVAFELELGDEKSKEVLTARTPQIRDAFLAYLADRSADDLRGSENMGKVKAALAQRIAEIAPGVPLRGFYIADLVVQ